jgi:S-adenosylmethionine:tRNA ribosyltransferase-isomerase
MLVASFIGLKETKRIYKEAIEQKYRFFSYGDGMLLI